MEISKTESKISLSKINLNKWVENGNNIPACINEGCKNKVAIRHWSAQGDPSLKTECSKCSNARKKIKVWRALHFIKKIIVKIKTVFWDLFVLWIKSDITNFQATYIIWTI